MCLTSPPPLLVIEVTPGTCPSVVPSLTLEVPGPGKLETYALRGIIYLGQYHFTARLLDPDGNIWSHNGQKNFGQPWLTGNTNNQDVLTIFNGREPYLYLYAL
jgi:hypothetical protein